MVKKKKRRRLKKKWRYRFSLLAILLALWLILGPIRHHFFTPTAKSETTTTTTAKKQKKKVPKHTWTEQTFLKVAERNINLYTNADKNSAIIEPIPAGEILSYQTEQNGYYEVTTNKGNHGFVSYEDVTKFTQPISQKWQSLENAIIVLDPGHGGDDAGAMSNDEKFYEKDMSMAMAKTVQKALEKAGAKVILTHESSDQYIYLDDINKLSMEKRADIFLSFHFDSADYANYGTGITTYYYYDKYKDLAQDINEQLQNLGLENRGIQYASYEVIRETTQPSLLLELGYMNNDTDIQYITSPDYRQKVAEDIVKGLEKYFNS